MSYINENVSIVFSRAEFDSIFGDVVTVGDIKELSSVRTPEGAVRNALKQKPGAKMSTDLKYYGLVTLSDGSVQVSVGKDDITNNPTVKSGVIQAIQNGNSVLKDKLSKAGYLEGIDLSEVTKVSKSSEVLPNKSYTGAKGRLNYVGSESREFGPKTKRDKNVVGKINKGLSISDFKYPYDIIPLIDDEKLIGVDIDIPVIVKPEEVENVKSYILDKVCTDLVLNSVHYSIDKSNVRVSFVRDGFRVNIVDKGLNDSLYRIQKLNETVLNLKVV